MTTKEQERKALELIKRTIESLGENSYIGTALEGCLEIAEENIDNDWACSMKERKEAAEAAEDTLRAKVEKLEQNIRFEEEHSKCLTLENEEKERVNEVLRNRAKLAEQAMKEEAERANRLAEKNLAMAREIVELKAKLYDLITK